MAWRGHLKAPGWLETLQAHVPTPTLSCSFPWTGPLGVPWAPVPHTFGAVPGGRAVALGFALLRGRGPQSLCALAGRLARVAGAAHCALLLPDAALRGALRGVAAEPRPGAPLPSPPPPRAPAYLAPLARHPASRGTAAQVATHGGRRLGRGRAVRGGQRGAVVRALAQDDAVAEAGPAARGALQLERGFGLVGAPVPAGTGGMGARRGQRRRWGAH